MKKLLFFFLALLPIIGMRAESTVVGNTDNTSAWWTAFSQDYVIQKGEKWHFQFTNHNDEGDVFHNYVLAITTDANRNDNVNGYKEYLMMRADNHHWGDGGTVRQWTYTDTEGKSFIQEMNGATVDMTVLYDENNNFYVNSTITTSSGRTFMHNAQTTGADGSQCRLFFIVEKAHIEITTAEKVSRLAETRAGLNNSWTMITSADDLKAKAQSGEYFFTIADASRDLMISWYDNTLSYRQSVNPVEHLTRLFYIEHAIVDGEGNAATEGTEVYNLRNVEHSKYLMQTGNSGAEWQIAYNDQAITVSWTNLDIAFPHTNGVCTMAWHMHNYGNNYFGTWDELPELNLSTMSLDGTAKLAGNKSGSYIGTYVIYAIERVEFLRQYIGESTEKDLTKFLINPSFESRGWYNRGDFLGWSQIEGNTTALELVVNNSLKNKEGTVYAQRYQTAGTYGVQQTINHLPNGVYKVQAATSYSGNSDIAKLFAGSTEKGFIGNNLESYVVGKSTDNSLTIGAKITNVGNNRWFAVDNFRLAYMGNALVGDAIADRTYVQPGQTVTISYNDAISILDDALSAGSQTAVTIGEKNVNVTLTENGFTFDVPELAAGQQYTLSIPAGIIGYTNAAVYNAAQEIVLSTPNIFDGTYYITTTSYNDEQMFLGRGAAYGTEAALSKYGLAVKVVTGTDNKTTFQFVDTDQYLYRANGTGIYTDGGTNDNAWAIHKTEGGFTIDYTNGNTIRVDDGFYGNYLHTNSATSDHRVVWNPVTKAERDAILAGYAAQNKANVATLIGEDNLDTYLEGVDDEDLTEQIPNNKSGEQGAWQWTDVFRNPQTFSWTDANCYGWYNGAGYASQSISGLKPGVYKVTVDAIDRLSSVNQENYVRSLGYDENQSYLKANGEQVRCKSWYEVHASSGSADAGYPYWSDGAAECMAQGYATVEVYTYVGEAGILNLEINKPSYTFMQGHAEQSNFVFNNFTLTYYGNGSISIADNVAPDYTPATYKTINITRTLKQGWNTICLPFTAEVSDVAGADAMAYEFSSATDDVLSFTEVSEMEANVPYLLYCGTEVVNPTLHNVTLMEANAETVTNGKWSFIGNYTPGFVMEGKYGVTNGQVRLAGSGSTLNGMRAYFNFEGSGDAQAKIKVDGMDSEDDETAISTINSNEVAVTFYSLDGKRLAAPVKGINIVKFNNNTIRKILVK